MIIMTLVYAQRTGDVKYMTKHYPKLLQWAQFLIDESLVPASQLSTDDFAGTLAYVSQPPTPSQVEQMTV